MTAPIRIVIPVKAGIQSFQDLLDAGSSPAWRKRLFMDRLWL